MEFRILGPLEVVVAGRPAGLGGARHERILAALLLAAGRPVSLTRLADVAYDDPLDGSRRQVQNRVSALRALLAKADHGNAGGELIVRQGNGYLLRTTREQVDAFVFDDLTARARTLAGAGDRVGAARVLRRALALWRGPALDGLDCQPLHRQVAGLDDARLAAWENCLDLELATAVDAGPFVAELRTLAARHPLRQRLTALLMTALYRDGRQADALTAYRELAARLADEHGLDPTTDLQNLHQAVLRDDVPRPPAEAGPPAGQDQRRSVPAQLPAAVHGFTGRVAHLDALDTIAATVTGRRTAIVVTAINGTAGVGKTALAVHWAHRVRHRFPDGQLYTNLRGFDPGGQVMDSADAVRTFLDALAVPPQRIPASPDAQAALYRSLLADRRMLILLDNARDAEQVRPLLPGTPTALVVVTSRNQLSGLVAVDGAHPLCLDLLTQDEARQLLAGRLGAARVAAEPHAVQDIIARCARLPLALTIAAARATQTGFPLATVAAELAEAGGLDALSGGDAASEVRAVFSWSYTALTPAAARLFRLLGLHPGPDISVPAAASLAALPVSQARKMLAELTRASLLAEHTPGRYTFHDLLQAYAADLAHTTDPDEQRHAATHRLLDHHLHTAFAAAALLEPQRETITIESAVQGAATVTLTSFSQAQAWLTAEHRVLVHLVGQAANQGFGRHTWQLAWTMATFLHRSGHWHDQTATLHIALETARRHNDPLGRAYSHLGLARAYFRTGRYDDAHDGLRAALDLFIKCDHDLGQARAHNSLGFFHTSRSHYREALEHLQMSLDLFRAAGRPQGAALTLNDLGWNHALLGDYSQALTYCQQALTLLQKFHDIDGQASTLDSLGYIHHHLGHYPQAIDCYQQALDLFRKVDERFLEADTLVHLGDTHHVTGNPAARTAWQHALAILTDFDHPDAGQVRAKLAALDTPTTGASGPYS